jgi:phosphate starvation-inducible membrane PsiE
MQDGEATLAWVLFWVFTAITTVATFFITDHHRSRGLAWGLAALSLTLFIGLYFALQALLRYLGL